jgi:DNA-binding GntR family transcriptional regulator
MPELIREQIYQNIKKDILSGVYRPGEQLSANQLAERYQISATPVREALNALEQEGFVDVFPRIGFFVSHVTVTDIRSMYDYRIILEGASAEMAARYITQEELEALAKIPSDYIVGDNESYLEYLKNNREFHLSVAKASHNHFLAKAVAMMLDQTQRLVFLGIESQQHTDEILQAHPRLVEALRQRNATAAREIMIEGIKAARDAAIEQIIYGSDLPVHNKTDYMSIS